MNGKSEVKESKFCPINSHPQSMGMCQEERCALWDCDDLICSYKLIGKVLKDILEVINVVYELKFGR